MRETIPEDLKVWYEAAQEALGTPAIKAFDAERGEESNCILHPCYDKFRTLPTPRNFSTLIERIAKAEARNKVLEEALRNTVDALELMPGHSTMKRVIDEARAALREDR